MDPLAGKKNEDDSSLTPWELIDPDEPANGPAPKPQAEDEAEGVAAYSVETDEPSVVPQTAAVSETEPVAAEAQTIVMEAITPQSEISAPTEAAGSQEPWQWDQVDAVQHVDSLCTLPALAFEAELPTQSEEASLPAAAVIAPEPDQSEPDSLLDLCIDEALAEPRASQAHDSSTTITTSIDSQPELSAPADVETPEMFGETIAALDAMPDTMGEIADITQAVGEAPPVEVLDHALTVQASAEPVEDVPVSADALRDVLEAATISEPVETESSQTVPEEIAPEPEPEPRPQVRSYAPPQEEEWLDEEEDSANYDDAEEDDADLAEAVFTEDEADVPEPRWEDPELDGELAPVASDGGGWTIPLLCAGIAIIACCMVMPQIDANRRLAYEKMTLKSDLALIQKQVSVNDEFLKKIVDDPSLAERLAQRQLKRVRKGQHVLKIRDEKPDMSPFQITAVTPPPAPPPYKPLSGTIANLCYSARNRLYLTGIALAMIAFGLVLGAAPQRTGGRASA